MKITNCNTMEKVVCGCTLSFSSYVATTTSVLDVGNLVGGSCTLPSYVIDWYRNGNKELVSGTNGAAPDIQAIHPFTGTAAIPVPGGTWVPVIRWVIIGGVKYYSQPSKCKKWCDSLTGLPSITVSSLNCSSTNQSGDYQYKLSYVSTQDYSYATRTIRWYLSVDTRWFAFNFLAYTVADKISIFKNEETQPITSWISGANLNTNNISAMPYRTTSSVKQVLDMQGFTTGDYLRIEITPSVLESNINTNWDLYMKCLTSAADFAAECDTLNTMAATIPDFNSFSFTDQIATNCRILFNFNMNSPAKPITDFPLLNKYSGLGLASTGIITTNIYTTGEVNLIFTRSSYGNGQYCGTNNVTCYNAAGTVTVTKSGGVYTIACTHINDYTAYKNQWNAQVASTCWTGWVNDPTVLAYYKFFYFRHRKGSLCGDSQGTELSIYGHITSTWVWDDINMTCTFTPATVTNQIPAVACDTSTTWPNSYISSCNASINLSETDYRLGASTIRSLGWASTNASISNNFVYTQTGGLYYYANALAMPCIPSKMFISGIERRLFSFYMQVAITNDADRDNNFEIKSYVNYQTGAWVSPPTLIYKKLNGVQTFPIP